MEKFKEVLRRYPAEDLNEHNALVINDVVYLGYEGYCIQKRTKNPKLAKVLQRKLTTALEY